MDIANILKDKIEALKANPEQVIKLQTKTRKDIIKEIYELYTTERQKTFRSRENWRRYVNWLKTNKVNEKTLGRTETVKLWKKKGTKEYKFLKEMSTKELAIFLAPFNAKNNNLDALYYLASLGRDMNNRKENFSSFLMWSTNYKIK